MRKHLICIVIIFLLFTVLYGYTINAEKKKNREVYAPELEWMENMSAREKQWILENQGEAGEIYMNGSEAGDVNPYFSCMAALGLLEEIGGCKVEEKHLEAVARYLNWHTERLFESDGQMGIYQIIDKQLQRVKKADSVDAYLGVYLELISKYLTVLGDEGELLRWKEEIDYAVYKLYELMADGVFKVSEENKTKYLMDNLEVWKGLKELEQCLEGLMKEPKGWKKLYERIVYMRITLEESIPTVFWDKEEKRWRVHATENFLENTGFYPDGIAQIYALIYSFPETRDMEYKKMYVSFNKKFVWKELENRETEFWWTMTGMAALNVGDITSAREFLHSYEKMTLLSREYPLYTGEAGWVLRECVKYYKLCQEKINVRFPFGFRSCRRDFS